ncbi:hypothetical protein [Microbacterium sp. SORGH_AS_0862]|uniref:hypothetical protein n=1 Tax=Microbacterium sp. SORGH_AS_0862 TaxID=3041789 RepID=UPI00278D6F04|nr:hypothetical protein [Microbacterium sp. SORGH_AS_0862]MDQ1205484.1 hypothetical protein [Microbacterium sp. SORGH_AS_0862]
MYAHRQLRDLAERQRAVNIEPYRIILRLLGHVLTDGAPTPQIGDNGDGGVAVDWLVDDVSVRLDYEDETEILLTAVRGRERILCDTLTKWWVEDDVTIKQARELLSGLAGQVRNPIPLS